MKLLKFIKNNTRNYFKFLAVFIFLALEIFVIWQTEYLGFNGYKYAYDDYTAKKFHLSVLLLSIGVSSIVSFLIYLLKDYGILKNKFIIKNNFFVTIINFIIATCFGGMVYFYAYSHQILPNVLGLDFFVKYYTFIFILFLFIVLLAIFKFPKKLNKKEYFVRLLINLLEVMILQVIIGILTLIIIEFTGDILSIDFIYNHALSFLAIFTLLFVVPSFLDIFSKQKTNDYINTIETYKEFINSLAKIFLIFWAVFSVLLFLYTIEFFMNVNKHTIAIFSMSYLGISALTFLFVDINSKKHNKSLNVTILLVSLIQDFVMIYAVLYRVFYYGLTVPRAYVLFSGIVYFLIVIYFLWNLYQDKRYDFKVPGVIIIFLLFIFTYIPSINLVDLSFSVLTRYYFQYQRLLDKSGIVRSMILFKGFDYAFKKLGHEVYSDFNLNIYKKKNILPTAYELKENYKVRESKVLADLRFYGSSDHNVKQPDKGECTVNLLYSNKGRSIDTNVYTFNLQRKFEHMFVCNLYQVDYTDSYAKCSRVRLLYDSSIKSFRVLIDNNYYVGTIPVEAILDNIKNTYTAYKRIVDFKSFKCTSANMYVYYYPKQPHFVLNTPSMHVEVFIKGINVHILLSKNKDPNITLKDAAPYVQDAYVDATVYVFY